MISANPAVASIGVRGSARSSPWGAFPQDRHRRPPAVAPDGPALPSRAVPDDVPPVHPFLDAPPLAFAHRGGAGDWPENTMPAFAGAVDLGYRHLETDVHLTADGVLLAFHDDALDRVTDRTGVIAELPWSQVQAARVDGREPIPRFDELLATWPD